MCSRRVLQHLAEQHKVLVRRAQEADCVQVSHFFFGFRLDALDEEDLFFENLRLGVNHADLRRLVQHGEASLPLLYKASQAARCVPTHTAMKKVRAPFACALRCKKALSRELKTGLLTTSIKKLSCHRDDDVIPKTG